MLTSVVFCSDTGSTSGLAAVIEFVVGPGPVSVVVVVVECAGRRRVGGGGAPAEGRWLGAPAEGQR